MISLSEGKIVHGDQESEIRTWVVWFMTFNGLHETRISAVDACLKADIDPDRSIVPVPIAIDYKGRYEVASRLI